jgi:hypothetical protein
MKNVVMEIKGNIMTIKIDLSKAQGLSKSGKTEVIASTLGNVPISGKSDYRLGLNCYRYPTE